MEKFWILILLGLFATKSLDEAESVKLELKTFDEIFGEGWWDKGEAEDLKTPASTNFGQNVHHQIDRQNTQIGQIELNSTDQLGQIEPNSTDQNPPLTESDHSRQIEPNLTDQNLPLTKSDHFDKAKNGEEQNEVSSNENSAEDELKQKFDQMKAELTRAGFKNAYSNQIDETVAKELGLSFVTIYNWKRKLGQSKPNKYSDSEQKEWMKRYYEIKGKNPKISDKEIVKLLKIGRTTLYKWKSQFKRGQLHPNVSVDGNAGSVREIGNSNSEIVLSGFGGLLRLSLLEGRAGSDVSPHVILALGKHLRDVLLQLLGLAVPFFALCSRICHQPEHQGWARTFGPLNE
uniref:Uncharacterized protein n=1 Tax=Globodera rostochiensis TaxID=31243 RepID=A0A914HS51_GLORO